MALCLVIPTSGPRIARTARRYAYRTPGSSEGYLMLGNAHEMYFAASYDPSKRQSRMC